MNALGQMERKHPRSWEEMQSAFCSPAPRNLSFSFSPLTRHSSPPVDQTAFEVSDSRLCVVAF